MAGETHETQYKEDKPWDDSLKRLARSNPEAFVTLVLGAEAHFIRELPEKLKSLTREMDALFEVSKGKMRFLLHIEFQTYHDPTMAKRLLIYNVLANFAYELPVQSCVIYLLEDEHAPSSPYRMGLEDGTPIWDFYFQNLQLAELTQEELLSLDEPGVLPLLTLAREGATRQTVNVMLTGLQQAHRSDLMAIGINLASLIFGKKDRADQDWLLRRFNEMSDLLRETPIYQHILQEGLEKGLEQGLEKGLEKGREQGLVTGLEKGRLETLRETIEDIVLERFPKLGRLARKQVATVDDVSLLRHLTIKISTAKDAKEVKQLLLSVDEDEEE